MFEMIGLNWPMLLSMVSLTSGSTGKFFFIGIDRVTNEHNLAVGLPFYQPKLCPSATWDPSGTTIVNGSTLGYDPTGIFIDLNNSIYVAETHLHRVQAWIAGNSTPARTLSTSLIYPHSVFVTRSRDIYVDNGYTNRTVLKWPPNSTVGVTVMSADHACIDLFIDINEMLYCSYYYLHRVVKKSLNNSGLTPVSIAGNGTIAATPTTLNYPCGIFIDDQFSLYVADSGNHRVQFFPFGQSNATTLAGNGTSPAIALRNPTGIMVDADGYLFITDRNNHRVVRSGPHGYQCIVGCTGTSGLAANQLRLPWTLHFDSGGNLFVNDRANRRLQKFLLHTNSCGRRVEMILVLVYLLSVVVESSTRGLQFTAVTSTSFVVNSSTSNWNVSSSVCDVLKPCENNGTCSSTATAYMCSCPSGFHGVRCQFNHLPCASNTCWNDGMRHPFFSVPRNERQPLCHIGTCNTTSNSTFVCVCTAGFHGTRCATPINVCQNVVCLNHGVCRSSRLDYSCECLSDSYSGRYCERSADDIVLRRTISRSVGYVAITALIMSAMFIVTLDLLKYGFGVDPVNRPEEKLMRRKRLPVAIRFIYINTVSSS